MQCACAIVASVAWPTMQYFPTLSHKRHDFRKIKVVEHKMCFDFLYNFYLKHFSLQEELSETWTRGILVFMYSTSYSSAILMNIEFCWQIFEKYYHISWKSVQWKQSCSIRKDGRTDMTKLKVIFCNLANAAKKVLSQLETWTTTSETSRPKVH